MEYDAHGRRSRARIIPGSGHPFEQRYTYDGEGRLIREESLRQGIVFEHTSWEFNERGDVHRIELVARKDTGRVQEFSYEYDAQGNWTLRRMSETTRVLGEAHPRRTEVTRRELEYY